MNLQILFPNASARLLAFPTFNDFNGPTQFGCTVSNEDGFCKSYVQQVATLWTHDTVCCGVC
jgi:hypothetical protein